VRKPELAQFCVQAHPPSFTLNFKRSLTKRPRAVLRQSKVPDANPAYPRKNGLGAARGQRFRKGPCASYPTRHHPDTERGLLGHRTLGYSLEWNTETKNQNIR